MRVKGNDMHPSNDFIGSNRPVSLCYISSNQYDRKLEIVHEDKEVPAHDCIMCEELEKQLAREMSS